MINLRRIFPESRLLGLNPFAGRQHVAVMSVHNIAADFISSFEGTLNGQAYITPAAEGVTFFRTHYPASTEAQLAAFKSLHQSVGLDTVVVFDTGFVNFEKSLAIAQGVKEIDPDIELLAQVSSLGMLLDNSEITESFPQGLQDFKGVHFNFHVSNGTPLQVQDIDWDEGLNTAVKNAVAGGVVVLKPPFDHVIGDGFSPEKSFRQIFNLPTVNEHHDYFQMVRQYERKLGGFLEVIRRDNVGESISFEL